MIKLKRFVSNRNVTNVTITWSEAIAVEKFQKDQLSTKEQGIASNEDVIYIFVGENQKEDAAVDVGQTTRALEVRTNEHLRDGDFLEGFPQEQKVYCGSVSASITIDNSLLEQIEGIIIQYLNGNDDYHLCNVSKKDSYSQFYAIGYIENNNLQGDLITLLPQYLQVED